MVVDARTHTDTHTKIENTSITSRFGLSPMEANNEAERSIEMDSVESEAHNIIGISCDQGET